MSFDRTSTARDLAIAVSLANLWHVRHWSWLLNRSHGYFMDQPPHWSMPATTILGVAVSATAFFVAARLVRRFPRRWLVETSRLCFIAVFAFSLNAVRQQAYRLTFDAVAAALGGRKLVMLLLALVGAVLLAAFAFERGRQAISRALAAVALCFAPLVAVNVGQALWLIARYERLPPEFRERGPAPLLAPRPPDAPRILFIIFDGMDQNLTFDHRQADVILPEFDRLLAECVHLDNAYAPVGTTKAAIPALTTGLPVVGVGFASANDLALQLAGDARRIPWSQTRNVFDRARELGVSSALAGWYHPYCRVLGSSLTACESRSYLPPPSYTVRENARRHLSLLLGTVPSTIRLHLPERLGLEALTPRAQRRWHLSLYENVHRAATAAATDARYGLVFAHYPIPHLPFIYDRHAARTDADGPSAYVDNLSLADRTLGELRLALERASLSDATTLIVTSDHWDRTSAGSPETATIADPRCRVPFLVKCGTGSGARVCRGLFRTQHAHDLALAVLAGTVREPQQVAAWIDQHSEGPRSSTWPPREHTHSDLPAAAQQKGLRHPGVGTVGRRHALAVPAS